MALTDRIVTVNGDELVPGRYSPNPDYHWEQSEFPIFAFNVTAGSKPDILGITVIENGLIVSRAFYRPRGNIRAGEAGEWVSLLEPASE